MAQTNRFIYSLAVVLFLFANSSAFSQDLIVQKNGGKIYCRIIRQDSINIYYSVRPQNAIFEIRKADVASYYGVSQVNSSSQPSQTLSPGKSRKEILSLSLLGGCSLPLGDLKKQDIYDAAGFAKTGALFHARVNIKVAKFTSITASFHYQSLPFDGQGFDKQLGIASPARTYSTEGSDWKVQGVYLGFNQSFSIPEVPKLFFDLSLSAGYANCTSPEIHTIVSSSGRPILSASELLATAWAPSFLGGLGFHYKTNQKIDFNIGANLFSAKPAFNDVIIYNSSGFYASGSDSQKMMTLNFYAGLTFALYGKRIK